jgi:8-oxo-dGTP pyrophosphatase MutT (NUDIX family)
MAFQLGRYHRGVGDQSPGEAPGSLGEPPDGAGMAFSPELRALVTANLNRFRRAPSESPRTRAAVAVVLMTDERGRPCVPVTQRAGDLARHAGQMALPGGKLNDGESAESAAIRELHEELGLTAMPDAALGLLDDFETRSGFTITPVVMWSDATASSIVPSRGEVARIFLLTLEEVRAVVGRAAGGTSPSFHLDFSWGSMYAPTAAILYQFREVALAGHSTRVGDFYQPPFTHR